MARNDEKKSIRCSFCGKHQDQVRRLIAGPGAYICNECVQLCMGILSDDVDLPEEGYAGEIPDEIPTPREIHQVLDQYIIGQDQAKVALSVAVYNTTSASILEARRMWSSRRATSCSWAPPAAARPCLPRPWPES